MTTLTHRERAERAAKIINVPGTAGDIAREMFPRELVEAARWLLGRCEEMDWPDSELDELRAVLDLYPEPEEETTS